MDEIFLVNSSSFQILEVSTSLIAAPSAVIDLSQASIITGSFSGRGDLLTNITASYIVHGSNITASFATSASNAQSASYISPGATFYMVSGSDGIAPSYIEPYDYCPTSSLYRPPFKEGRMIWDHKYTDYTHYMNTSWRMHLGKEVNVGVYNPYPVTMSRLTAIYLSGSSGGNYQPDIHPAIADGTNTRQSVIGVIRADIPPLSSGFCLTEGEMHNTDVTTLGAKVGEPLYLSPTMPGGLTIIKPGEPNEVVLVGYVSELNPSGSFIVNSHEFPKPANAYAGMTSYPTIIDNTSSLELYIGNGTVNLYTTPTGNGAVTQFAVNSVTFSLNAGITASFIYATTNGTTASYGITDNFDDINGTNKIQVATIYRADIDAHIMEIDRDGLALANKLQKRLIETNKFSRVDGFSLSEAGDRQFIITAGSAWYGATKFTVSLFDSRFTQSVTLPINYDETHLVYHSASQWIIPVVTDGKYNNLYYDNGTNLTPLAPLSYSVNYLYRILGDNIYDDDTFILLSNHQYVDLDSAKLDKIPDSIPNVLDNVSILVGRIIFQSGSNSAAAVESAFTTNFGQSLVTQHNSLGGLQGGIGGQYYHLGLVEYTGTGNGVFVRADNAELTNARLTGSLQGTASYSNRANISDNLSFVPLTSVSASAASSSISSSYATNAETAYSLGFIPTFSNSASWVSSSVKITTADTASYILATNISGTPQTSLSASYASASTIAYSINFVPNTALTTTHSIYSVSSSWISASVKITTADTASYISPTLIGTPSSALSASFASASNVAYSINFVPLNSTSASWVSASVKITTADTASYINPSLVGTPNSAVSASYASASNMAYSINFVPLNSVSSSWVSASVLINSSSYARTASVILGTVNSAINATYATSASWVSASAKITTADTASYINPSLIGTPNSALSASYASASLIAHSINFIPYASVSASWVSASITITTADTASYINPSLIGTPTHAVSASWASSSISASYAPGSPSISSSYSDTSISSSYAVTASYALAVDNQEILMISGSNWTTTIVTATATPLSFSMLPNEIWRFEVFSSAQCSGTGGTKYAISCSLPVRMVEGWVMGATNAITATTRQRLTARNTLQTNAVHIQTTTPGNDSIWGMIMNFTGSTAVSLAVASTTNGQTSTLFAGTHMIANKVGMIN